MILSVLPQLVTLASLHVVVYTTLGLLLPWLYLYPTADLFLCMRRPLFNDILSREEFSTEWIITFVSVVFLIPVLMTLILWHVVMAFSLFRLLGRKVGPCASAVVVESLLMMVMRMSRHSKLDWTTLMR